MKHLMQYLFKIVTHWNSDNVSTYSAALAYYTLFALAPLIIICTALTGLFFGQDFALLQIINFISHLIGAEGAQQIQTMISKAQSPIHGITAEIISFILLLLAASGVFSQIQLGLNAIWKVKELPHQSMYHWIKSRFLSFAMVLCVAFLLLVSLILNVYLTLITTYFDPFFQSASVVAWFLEWVVSTLVTTLLFAMIYKILPDILLKWSDVLMGAFITALLFNFGKYLLGLYLTSAHIENAYGPAGSLIIILIWIYYTSQILFIGAEVTKVRKVLKN